jgi:hypothetical protein
MMSRTKWTLGGVAAFLISVAALGCQLHKEQSPAPPVAGTTQPTGLDLDQEKRQMNRRLSSLGDATIRIYEYADGQLGVDERLTFADRQALLNYLNRQDAAHLSAGIVYFINRGEVKDKVTFAAVKDFCIRHNVNLYVGEGGWPQRKAAWMDIGWVHDEVVWVVKSRP